MKNTIPEGLFRRRRDANRRSNLACVAGPGASDARIHISRRLLIAAIDCLLRASDHVCVVEAIAAAHLLAVYYVEAIAVAAIDAEIDDIAVGAFGRVAHVRAVRRAYETNAGDPKWITVTAGSEHKSAEGHHEDDTEFVFHELEYPAYLAWLSTKKFSRELLCSGFAVMGRPDRTAGQLVYLPAATP